MTLRFWPRSLAARTALVLLLGLYLPVPLRQLLNDAVLYLEVGP